MAAKKSATPSESASTASWRELTDNPEYQQAVNALEDLKRERTRLQGELKQAQAEHCEDDGSRDADELPPGLLEMCSPGAAVAERPRSDRSAEIARLKSELTSFARAIELQAKYVQKLKRETAKVLAQNWKPEIQKLSAKVHAALQSLEEAYDQEAELYREHWLRNDVTFGSIVFLPLQRTTIRCAFGSWVDRQKELGNLPADASVRKEA